MKMRGLFLTLQNPTKIYVTGELGKLILSDKEHGDAFLEIMSEYDEVFCKEWDRKDVTDSQVICSGIHEDAFSERQILVMNLLKARRFQVGFTDEMQKPGVKHLLPLIFDSDADRLRVLSTGGWNMTWTFDPNAGKRLEIPEKFRGQDVCDKR